MARVSSLLYSLMEQYLIYDAVVDILWVIHVGSQQNQMM